jgi:flagellar hook-associated protein 2
MDFRMTGLGSGLDIDAMVKAYVDAEKVPQEVMIQKKQQSIEAKISALAVLESETDGLDQVLKQLSTPTLYAGKAFQLDSNQFFEPTIRNDAMTGAYDIKVVSLAEQHKVTTPGEIYFSPPTDPTTEPPQEVTLDKALGAKGSLTIKIDGMGQSIEVTETMTLLDIKQAIDDIDLTTPYVTPSLVTSAIGTQLILVSDEMGEKFEIEIDVQDDDLVDSTGAQSNAILTQLFGDKSTLPGNLKDVAYLGSQTLRGATDATLTLDGIPFTHNSNEIENILPGVDIKLLKSNQAADPATRMGVYVDQTELLGLLYEFVDRYNNLLDSVEDNTYFGATADSRGPLAGDYMARSLRNELQIRGEVTESGLSLGSIGVNYTQGGRLELDETKLRGALASNSLDLQTLFIDEDKGIITRMRETTQSYIKYNGSFSQRQDGFDTTLKDLAERQERLDLLMEEREAQLYQKFNVMDEILGRLEKLRDSLKDMFDSLPSANSKKD